MTNNQTKIVAEPGKQELFIIREFDAPREHVFKTFTAPDLFAQWLGLRELTMVLETFEPQRHSSLKGRRKMGMLSLIPSPWKR